MKTIALQTADGRRVAGEVRIADSFVARSIGLLRDEKLDEHKGLLLIPGGSVHTFGMRFAIDVVFLDRRMRVLDLAPNVTPGRLRLAPPGTRRVLELSAGRIAAVGLLIGAYLVVEHDEHTGKPRAATRCIRSHASLPPRCTRPPVQFSLRLPPQHRGTVHSNLGCTTTRDAPSRTQSGAATT